MPLTSAPLHNLSRSPITRKRGGSPPASVPPDPPPATFFRADMTTIKADTTANTADQT